MDRSYWLTIAATVVALTVRAVNTDAMTGLLSRLFGRPVSIPSKALPWLALALGLLSGVLDRKVNGQDWQHAIGDGFLAAATAALSYSLGKSIPKIGDRVVAGRSSRRPPPLFAFVLIGAIAASSGTAACTPMQRADVVNDTKTTAECLSEQAALGTPEEQALFVCAAQEAEREAWRLFFRRAASRVARIRASVKGQ